MSPSTESPRAGADVTRPAWPRALTRVAGAAVLLTAMSGAITGVAAWADEPSAPTSGPSVDDRAPPPPPGQAPHARPGGREARGPGGMGAGPMPPWFGPGAERWLAELSATDAQRTQIRQIGRSLQDDMKRSREQLRPLHEQLAQVFTQPSVDAAAAEKLRAQIQALQDDSSRKAVKASVDAANVLTAEQRKQLGERLAQWRPGLSDGPRGGKGPHGRHDGVAPRGDEPPPQS